MQLSIKPYHKNSYPKTGILIRGASPAGWLMALHHMDVALAGVTVYAVPGTVANSVYGCVVVFNGPPAVKNLADNALLQLVNGKVFIPEYAVLSPMLADAEWERLFKAPYYFYHPETGLAELTESVNWSALITAPPQAQFVATVPLNSVSIPQQVTAFFIEADLDAIAAGMENPFGDDDPANLPFDMQKLLKGNQKEMDKYLKFLEKNPEMALRYAIPLDTLGTARGGLGGKFVFGKSGNGGGFKLPQEGFGVFFLVIIIAILIAVLFSSISSGKGFPFVFIMLLILLSYYLIKRNNNSASRAGGGNALLDSDRFNTLREHYENMIDNYLNQGDYKKAAHIYLKLLKDNLRAAQVLEEGKHYPEAAHVYLNHCQNKVKAAECYENGKIYTEALKLYKDMQQYEKAGDMYALLNRKKDAEEYYHMVADDYKKNYQYVKASLIYKYKIQQPYLAQDILLEGWASNKDAHNCLNNYFSNIPDAHEAGQQVVYVYQNHTNQTNQETFLQVIKHEYTKHEELQETVKDIAYEIIAGRIHRNPNIASELIFFNKQDKSIVKDVMKYKAIGRAIRL